VFYKGLQEIRRQENTTENHEKPYHAAPPSTLRLQAARLSLYKARETLLPAGKPLRAALP
jgi:hypothetical protein